ncbi:hypothetical protein [Pseudomonas promysalinigenes]|uniref:Uncharacterized protein n=1 Tax=Pseudomonas promysalinigenes TaxID=485898 RepID=A0ABY6ARV7_9PSED|nr:hypothetical protein [Pseudomonas promysalinigenes]UXH41937.1 hypothetical protein N5C08_10600 [Pseudomonas promysalinigenes]
MNTISDIVVNEPPTDVILWLARRDGISHPRLDNLYNRNGWANIGDCLQLIDLIKKMIQDGLIQQGGSGYIKGPNWREPEFLKQNKYEL